MHSFSAIYYDGKTSRSKVCEVFLSTEKLTISYTESNDFTHFTDSIDWDISLINQNDINISSSKALLSYGSFPKQLLEVSAADYENVYLPFYKNHQNTKTNYASFVGKKGMEKLVIMGAAVVALIAGLYFFVVPFVAENIATSIVSPSLEKEVGDNFYESFIEYAEVDTNKTEIINRFYKTLQFKTEYNIRLTVLKSDIPNAFALPGGNIVVHDSIIRMMNHSEELSALLSHEVSHVHHRHAIKGLFKNLAGYFLISLVSGDVNGVLGVVMSNANSLKELQNSRSLEQDADLTGLELLQKSNIDPEGMILLFEKLGSVSKDSANNMLSFLSTHPLSSERIDYIKTTIKQKGQYIHQKDTNRELIWNELRGY